MRIGQQYIQTNTLIARQTGRTLARYIIFMFGSITIINGCWCRACWLYLLPCHNRATTIPIFCILLYYFFLWCERIIAIDVVLLLTSTEKFVSVAPAEWHIEKRSRSRVGPSLYGWSASFTNNDTKFAEYCKQSTVLVQYGEQFN